MILPSTLGLHRYRHTPAHVPTNLQKHSSMHMHHTYVCIHTLKLKRKKKKKKGMEDPLTFESLFRQSPTLFSSLAWPTELSLDWRVSKKPSVWGYAIAEGKLMRFPNLSIFHEERGKRGSDFPDCCLSFHSLYCTLQPFSCLTSPGVRLWGSGRLRNLFIVTYHSAISLIPKPEALCFSAFGEFGESRGHRNEDGMLVISSPMSFVCAQPQSPKEKQLRLD